MVGGGNYISQLRLADMVPIRGVLPVCRLDLGVMAVSKGILRLESKQCIFTRTPITATEVMRTVLLAHTAIITLVT